jgi:Secretion system C-terminal sorting domain
MKQLFLPLLLLVSVFAKAQTGCPGCTIQLPPLPADTIYLSAIPDGTQNVYYDHDLSFRMPKTTDPLCNTLPGVPCGLTISEIRIMAVTGLPLGLKWQANVASGVYVPATNTDGCVKICGTPLQADTFQVNVFVQATVFGQTQTTSIPLQMVINPQVSTTQGFSMAPSNGCAPHTVTFTNSIPSNGNTGFTYNWQLGSGLNTTLENPAPLTFGAAGTYPIRYTCVIDTVGYFLNSVDITASTCSDVFGSPDFYVIIKSPTGTTLLNTRPGVANTNAPVTIPISPAIKLTSTGTYTIEVWDEDNPPVDSDDACGTISFTRTSTGSLSGGGSTVSLSIAHPTTTVVSNDTVRVFAPAQVPAITAPALYFCELDSLKLTSSVTTGNQWYIDGVAQPNATNRIFYAKTVGLYSVVTTTVNGCTAQSQVRNVTSIAAPQQPFYYSSGNTLTLTDPSILPFNFALQWFKDGVLMVGKTAQNLTITATGTYTLEVTDLDTGCKNTYTSGAIFTGVADAFANTPRFDISPNPATTAVVLTAAANTAFTDIYVYDVLGKICYRKALNTNTLNETIDLTAFANGVYTLVLHNEKGERSTQRLVVNK